MVAIFATRNMKFYSLEMALNLDRGVYLLQVLLKRVTTPIIGFSSVARIEDALSARGKELTAEEERYMYVVTVGQLQVW
jgi:aryl-alcohol dehydrogenase-like predicted oxidoreductase